MKYAKRRFYSGIIMAVAILTGLSICAKAAENYRLMQIEVKDDYIIAYIAGEDNVGNVECQVGMIPCEDVEFTEVSGEKGNFLEKFHTIIMVDNSLSVTDENRAKAVNILDEYIQEKTENEFISVAVFGEDIQFIVERSTDKEELKNAVDSIEHNNQDTFLTDVLYWLLDTLEVEEYTRFIIVTDGVDNKIDISKDELLTKLKSNSHPIYTLGHKYKDNGMQLENLFSLSRATNGKAFLLDDINNEEKDVLKVVSDMKDMQGLIKIRADIPEKQQDGSNKSILFTVTDGVGKHEVRAQADMPFSVIQQTEPIEPEPEPVMQPTEPDSEPEEETTTIAAEDEKESGSGIVIYILAVVLVIIAAVVLVLNKKGVLGKKSSKEKNDKIKSVKKKANPTLPVTDPEQKAIQNEPESDETVIIDNIYMLTLRDKRQSDRIFKYPLKGKVIIGRNIDKVNIAIDYSKTISGQHCEITVGNNRFLVKDLNSSNKTYLNGHVINREEEIVSGDTIRLGEVEFSVLITPM